MNVNDGHLGATTQGRVFLWMAIYFTAAFTLASASNTDSPNFPSSVLLHVEDKYWKTPEAVEFLFLLYWLYPLSYLAMQKGVSLEIPYTLE
jgi:hypothetical protein